MTAKAFADMVTIGRIVRPQGRKGEVVVEPLSDRPDRFPSLRQALVAGEAAVLVVRGPDGEMLIPLADAFVRDVDLPRGRVVVRVPELVDAKD